MMGPSNRRLLMEGLTALALSIALPLAALAENVVHRPVSDLPSFVGYVPDELVVVFKQSSAHQIQALAPQAGRARANLDRVQRVLDRVAARGFEREFPTAVARPIGSSLPDLSGHYVLRLAPGRDLDESIAELSRLPDVDHVEKVGIHTVDLIPNDTYYQYGLPTFPYDQWHYHDMRVGVPGTSPYGIDLDFAWNFTVGNAGVAVGILDTGIRYTHHDLGGTNPPGPADNVTNGNIWVSPFDPPGGGDNEGNGFVDDVIGWDFVTAVLGGTTCRDPDCTTADNDPFDGDGHGTHVAGTVGAITNNGASVAGIAGGFGDGTPAGGGNGVRLIPLKIGYHAGIGVQVGGVVSMVWAAQAMNYLSDLVDRGVNVASINCSWGSSNTGGIMAAVTALQARDVLICVAAGNSNALVSSYLPTLPGVVCVGATDSTGMGASYSSFGPAVDLAAPGTAVMSTYSPNIDDGLPDGDYVALLSGTSMATPHVAGVTALMEALSPALNAQQKATIMIGTTIPFNPANTKVLGTGILNAYNSMIHGRLGVPGPPAPRASRLQMRSSPNPARDGTEMTILAPAGERVEMRIADAAGRLVRSMHGVADGTGTLRLRWDGLESSGRRAGAGLYFVSATGGGDRATSKLVVLE